MFFPLKRSSTCGCECRLQRSNYIKTTKFAAASFSAFMQLLRTANDAAESAKLQTFSLHFPSALAPWGTFFENATVRT